MKPDDFEQQLRRQPLRPPPPAWREQILEAARGAVPERHAAVFHQSAPWWREWLWPCPQAWAGLAAMWLLLFALRLTTSGTSVSTVAQRPGTSPTTQMAAAAQRREMIRLLEGPVEPVPSAKPASGPRSDLRPPAKA